MTNLYRFSLLGLGLGLAACGGGDNGNEAQALQVFEAATSQMASAQASAVESAQGGASFQPRITLNLNYSAACATSGTVGVVGTYDDSGTGQQTSFDETTTFSQCTAGNASLDGSLDWTSTASVSGSTSTYSASMTGSLTYHDPNNQATCDFDLTASTVVDTSTGAATVTYGGSVCGYDVANQLHVNGGA